MKTRRQKLFRFVRSVAQHPKFKIAAIGSGIGLSILITSCMSVNGPVMNPPSIPGATYVGAEECSMCHDKLTDNFHGASHALLNLRSEDGLDISCEACHGPGSLHAENGGDIPNQIINPGQDPQACFQCHLDKKGAFQLPSAHPVLEGRISCTDCHNPHEGSATKGGGTALMSENQTCFECHDAQRGPHVFEHEAMRDGCTTCHEVHGSVHPKLLKARNSNLCLQCHMTDFVQNNNADTFHSRGGGRIPRGACWSAGCHEAVHGSNSSVSLRY